MIIKGRSFIYLRLLLLSILGAFALSLISLYCLIQISEMVVEDYRYGYMMFIGKKIERVAAHRRVSSIDVNKYSAPSVNINDPMALLKDQTTVGSTPHRPGLWLVSDKGRIISGNTVSLPNQWSSLPHPKKFHEIMSSDSSLLKPKVFIIKLNTAPETFLILHNTRSVFQGPFLWVQGVHTFVTVALAVILALSICFYFVRRKSEEARKVLKGLASGDLKSRFKLRRFDQFKSLTLEFNLMANEIERLVKRLNNLDTSRSNLLLELGHDLRTPLTSLGISFEAVKFHYEQMSATERDEVFTMIESDIHYFGDLLEKLTEVATIGESHYKVSTEDINVTELLEVELRNRQSALGNSLNWQMILNENTPHHIVGDMHLISRLFKNALDNAAKYARKDITVKISPTPTSLEVTILDDGPGLTPEELESFGKRRERRQKKLQDPRNYSLGLGSVIMKTIADVHDGKVMMSNSLEGGACFKVIFKSEALSLRA